MFGIEPGPPTTDGNPLHSFQAISIAPARHGSMDIHNVLLSDGRNVCYLHWSTKPELPTPRPTRRPFKLSSWKYANCGWLWNARHPSCPASNSLPKGSRPNRTVLTGYRESYGISAAKSVSTVPRKTKQPPPSSNWKVNWARLKIRDPHTRGGSETAG